MNSNPFTEAVITNYSTEMQLRNRTLRCFRRSRRRLYRGAAVLQQPRGRRHEGGPAHPARLPLQQGHRHHQQEVRRQDPLGEAEQRGK